MDYVEGNGKRRGYNVYVRIKKAEKGYIIDMANYVYERELRRILNSTIIVGGTYFAPAGSLLKAWYAMDEFFDKGWAGSVHGNIEEIPYKEGVFF